MAMRKQKTRDLRRMMRGGLVHLAARVSPRERMGEVKGATDEPRSSNGRVDMGPPTHFSDDEEDRPWFRIGPIMSAILAAGIAWIAIVWWLVSSMPER